ncbi:MAG TPA: iron ABC transporter substrate-binding protein, partial [Spirochaetota bacterium]|nr:iron ABC transporter substrate-binding protein [Spirochaetota bacterium]
AYKGPHGLQSTEPAYPPFMMVNAENVVYDPSLHKKQLAHADVVKEKLVQWDPQVIFIDLSTMQLESRGNALYEIKKDPVYQQLTAVQSGSVYGVLPYNWYTKNFGSILANAYYIGKILYPEKFKDIDPAARADSIYKYLVGKAVFSDMNKAFKNKVFRKLKLKE